MPNGWNSLPALYLAAILALDQDCRIATFAAVSPDRSSLTHLALYA